MKTKPEITIPTAAELPALERRLVEISAHQAALAAEAKGIKERLGAWALAHPERHAPLVDAKREGRRAALPGGQVSVVLQSDLIIQTFPDGGRIHKALLGLLCEEMSEAEAPKALEKFFEPPCKWENRFSNGVQFRRVAGERLPPKIAARFISLSTQTDKAGIKKSKITFDIEGSTAATQADGEGEA